VSTSTARKCGSRRRDQKSRAHNDWNIPSHLLVSLGHLIFHGQKGCAPEFGSWSQITLAAPFPRPEDIRQADCHINDHLPINFSQFYRSASMPSRTSHEEPYDGHSRNDIGFNPLIGGAREGVLNETRSHRTFYRRSHRFRACCACARCIKQDTRPRDAGKGFQERESGRFRLRSGSGDAGERLEEWEPGCFRLCAGADQRLEHWWNEWFKLDDYKV
jgi:hypothetical protein